MKKLNLFCLMLLTGIILNPMPILAERLTVEEYVKIMGRGLAMTMRFDDFYPNTLSTLKNDGWDHIRLRCRAADNYADNFTDPVLGFDRIEFSVSKMLDAGLIPIISWTNAAALTQGLDWQIDDFVAWWAEIATRMKNLPNNDNISFNLIIEIAGDHVMGADRALFNEAMQRAITAIRNIDPTRIIIVPSPGKVGYALYDIDPGIFADEYTMAEFHSYAAGPMSTVGNPREWSGTGTLEDKQRLLDQFDEAVAWRGETGIPLYFGAWMPMGNQDDEMGIKDEEAQSFARFFLETCEYYRIPPTLNAHQHFYDEDYYGENDGEYILFKSFPLGTTENPLDMQAIYSIATTHANFLWTTTPMKYSVSTSTIGTGSGTITLNPSGGTYYAGTSVNAIASADAGSYLVGWTGDLSGVYSSDFVVMDSDKSVTATFDLIGTTTIETLSATEDTYVKNNVTTENFGAENKFWIKNDDARMAFIKFDLSSISSTIVGATLEITGAADNSGGNVTVYSLDDDSWDELTVTYNTAPDKGRYLGSSSLGASGTVYSIDVTGYVYEESNGDKTVSFYLNDALNNATRYDFATREAAGDIGPKLILELAGGDPVPQYTLTTSVVGNGSVSPTDGTYNESTVVTLTATPDAGYEFDSWSGDASGTNATTTITMDSDKNVTATFIQGTGPVITNLAPIDDSFVDANKTDNNYYNEPSLTIKNHSKKASATKITYIKFDLSSIGTVSNALLNLTRVSRSANVDIVEVLDDSWDETTITWNNAPATGNVITSLLLDGAESVNLTNYIAVQADGDNFASIALVTSGNSEVSISSKEGTSAPSLEIEHDGIPKSAQSVELSNISLYPNPTSGTVNINIADNEFSTGNVKVFNAYGAVIETKTIVNPNSQINLQDYNSGLYYIVISYNNTIVTKSVVKN